MVAETYVSIMSFIWGASHKLFSAKLNNKKNIEWGLCDIQNNQGRGRGYQPKPEHDNLYQDLDCSEYHKNRIE